MLAGLITNASNRSVNSGTLVISGDASGAGGTTTVNGGTLRLDYSTSDTSKLPESVLTLSGGTVELVDGTVAQAVLSTTLTAGKSTRITRPSGSARLDLRAVTSTGGGTVAVLDPSGTNALQATTGTPLTVTSTTSTLSVVVPAVTSTVLDTWNAARDAAATTVASATSTTAVISATPRCRRAIARPLNPEPR